jgi:hypothetical protein
MDVILVGVDHDVQWRDPTGNLQTLLADLIGKSRVDLIAEEAYRLPTTVAQRLACRLGKPWIDVDMNEEQRRREGIYEEAKKNSVCPLIEDGQMVGVMGRYLEHVEQIRENYWVSRILAQKVGSALVVCGSLHVGPFAIKLRQRGCSVQEVEVWKCDWYIRHFGAFTITENERGERLFELRHPQSTD